MVSARKRNFKEGELYWIRFYDHSIGSKDEMICEIVGWCIENRKNSAVFTHWVVDTKDDQVRKDNIEPTSIIKSTVLKHRKL